MRDTLAFTTWHKDFTYQGQVFKAAGQLIGVSFPSHSSEQREESLSFSIAMTAAPEQVRGLGPVETGIIVLYSDDQGVTWNDDVYTFAGRLSRSALQGRQWNATVEKDTHNRLEADAVISHVRQQVLHPGDLGLEWLASIAQGRILEWP